MNHQRIYIIFFVFVALICQIYISAAPIPPEIGDGVIDEKLPNNDPIVPPVPDPVLLQSTIYAAPIPPAIGDGAVSMTLSPTTTPKSDASNVMILPTALFAAFVIQMF
uniref:Uncharacterized protein n=1 Tax=Panagrolaimus sp. PS1159 TaxID=55785 RepID=A0AC35G3Y2_9BILA